MSAIWTRLSNATGRRRFRSTGWCTSRLKRTPAPRTSRKRCSAARCCRPFTASAPTSPRRERRRVMRCACWSSRSATPWNTARRSRSLIRAFPPIPRQSEPQLLERGGNRIRGDLNVVHLPPHVLPEPGRERLAPLLIRPCVIERVAHPLRHLLQVLPERLEVQPNGP